MSGTTNRGWRLGLVVLAAVTTGCTPYRVRTDYDQEVAFSSYRTFAWMDTSARSTEEANPFLERRLRRAVERVMGERGLREAPTGGADLLVTAFVIGPTRRDVRQQRWSSTACGPRISIWFGPRYPHGFSPLGSRWLFRSPYWRDPWGYACTYRIGFGYLWLPLYDAPGNRLAGTLVIDILDQASRDLVWRGSAEGALLDPSIQDQDQEEIDTIVREVLQRFPPTD